MTAVLSVEDVTITAGPHALAEHVSFALAPGEMLGLVGESGCGKTVSALAVLRLLGEGLHIASGRILVDGIDVVPLKGAALRAMRGDRAAMIFQEPMTSLNPVFTIGDQIAEVLEIHRGASRKAAMSRAADLLELVGLPNATRQLGRYPHQLSGGQRQRVMIAVALACEPKVLIADEPTTALDVTVQAQILALIDRLRRDLGMACLLITHDLGVVADVCDRASVMYAGRIVEEATAADLFAHPHHRYTRALLETSPAGNAPGKRLPTIPGLVPPPGQRGPGCPFAPRCSFAIEPCPVKMPPLVGTTAHRTACWNPAP